MDTTFRPAPGLIVANQFRLERKLGEGGMGEIYLAQQLEVERPVVLKFVHAQLASEHPETIARLRREAQTLAQVSHPNVVQLFTFGREQDQAYLVMEYVAGRTLAKELEYGAFDTARALHIGAQIVAGLSAAHQCGIVHRDLKPENVMLTHIGGDPDSVKLVDFGIARLVERDQDRLTRTGLVIGTPQYMAPEQIEHNYFDGRSDIYCFGLIFYEMLTGTKTFSGATPYDLLRQHVTARVIPPSTYAPGLTPAVEAIVLKCLHKEAGLRYASADELLYALRSALRVQPHGFAAPTSQPATASGSPSTPPAVARTTARAAPVPEPHGVPAARPAEPAHTPPPAAMPEVRPLLRLAWWGYGVQLLIVGVVVFQLLRSNVWQVFTGTPSPTIERSAKPAGGAPNALQRAVDQGIAMAKRVAVGADEQQLAAAATCLNRDADRAYDSYFRYDSWVDLARGPGVHSNVFGVYTLYNDRCPNSEDGGPDAEVSQRLASYAAALATLDELTRKADRYYDQEDYKDDGMRGGQAMHTPLLAAYRDFAQAEQALRAVLTQRRKTRDAALLTSLPESDATRPHHQLRLAARELVELGGVPTAKMTGVSIDAFRAALQRYNQVLERIEGGGSSSDIVRWARDLQESAKKYLRHLDKPGWSHGERMNVNDRLSGHMVGGSPYDLVGKACSLISTLNSRGQLGGIVELEPVIPYLPN